MSREEKLAEFVGWAQPHITGDKKVQAHIFLDLLFQTSGHPGVLDVGGQTKFHIRQAPEGSRGTAFADLVWKPVVLFEMKKRMDDLQRHYRQAFDYWTGLVPDRPLYVVLCTFDKLRVYDFDADLHSVQGKPTRAPIRASVHDLSLGRDEQPCTGGFRNRLLHPPDSVYKNA